ncbi:MAG: GIY-YIG nuclease family protein [Bacteroidales bacterium]|nr:GIY-YIG nuclease family protein [Bacteroidales bacterium]
MKRLYVYILECADDSFYVGVTNNVGRRFIEHMTGIKENSYTFNRRPLKLVFCREFERPMKAINYEKQVKGWTRAKKMALINSDFKLLHELAKCKNETSHTNYMVRVSEAERGPCKRSRTRTM